METYFVVPNEHKDIVEYNLNRLSIKFSTREGMADDSTRYDFISDGNTLVLLGMNYGIDLSIKRMQQAIPKP